MGHSLCSSQSVLSVVYITNLVSSYTCLYDIEWTWLYRMDEKGRWAQTDKNHKINMTTNAISLMIETEYIQVYYQNALKLNPYLTIWSMNDRSVWCFERQHSIQTATMRVQSNSNFNVIYMRTSARNYNHKSNAKSIVLTWESSAVVYINILYL